MFAEIPEEEFDWEELDRLDAEDARRGLDFDRTPAKCRATKILPGPQRVAVFEARYARRQQLFSPRDARFSDRTGLLLKQGRRTLRPDRASPVRAVHVKETGWGRLPIGPEGPAVAGRPKRRKRASDLVRTDKTRAADRERKRRARASARH